MKSKSLFYIPASNSCVLLDGLGFYGWHPLSHRFLWLDTQDFAARCMLWAILT